MIAVTAAKTSVMSALQIDDFCATRSAVLDATAVTLEPAA